MSHILIVEDQQDVVENLVRNLSVSYPDFEIQFAYSCDSGWQYLNRSKVENPVRLVILDLTFRDTTGKAVLKTGSDFLKQLKKYQIPTPAVIVYSTHDELMHIFPVMNNYNPQGYIIKSHNSTRELIFAISKVLQGETYYCQDVHRMQLQRFKFVYKIDETDEQILRYLPDTNTIQDWEGKILKDGVPLSYKTIKKKINTLCLNLEVENEKQLVLKLQRMAILK